MVRYFFILLFTFACSTGGKKAEEIPAWFYEIKPNDGTLIYGTGSSSIKQDAINNALSSAVSVIKTNVSSIISTDAQIVNGRLSESMRVQAINEVEKFSLSGYNVSKLEYNAGDYYAEVVIDKSKIYKEKLDDYLSGLAKLRQDYKDAQNIKTVVSSLHFTKTLSENADKLKQDASLLRALNPSFDYLGALNELNTFQNYRNKILMDIGFVVSGKNSNINGVLNAVITKRKLRTDGKNKVRISYNLGETSKGKIYSAHFAKTSINILMEDASGELSKSANFMFGGTSMISEDEAYKESLKELSKKFDEMLNDIL